MPTTTGPTSPGSDTVTTSPGSELTSLNPDTELASPSKLFSESETASLDSGSELYSELWLYLWIRCSTCSVIVIFS